MQYDFLKQFSDRMKHVGLYCILYQNSAQKTTWKQFGMMKLDEQINMIFAVMLYLMEQSLKEEKCTMDDIGAYIDQINGTYFMKNMSYEDCRQLGDFIVNVILSNEGRPMYFDCYSFEEKAYKSAHISYVANKVVYVDNELKRTSYYLTDDGYNLLLSTLEIESNMKLTIHEMIFKMHLEKQSYDKAAEEIKNVFNLLRMQLQKIQEAMLKVRRNALNYSVADYEKLLLENMDTISDTKQKFQNYRELVRTRAQELEQQNINVRKLDQGEEEKLNNLKEIESYLNRTIDEHQKILNSHFDLKILYDKELQLLSQMSLIQRFSIRTELYDKVMEDVRNLENIDSFLRPLFHQQIPKIYNLNKALEVQKPIRKRREEEQDEILDFDEDTWQKEQEEKRQEKQKKYEGSLAYILDCVMLEGKITLSQIKQKLDQEDEQQREICIPNVDIFKEIMVELIKSKEIDVTGLREERSQYIVEQTDDFQLYDCLLQALDRKDPQQEITGIQIYRLDHQEPVIFEHVKDTDGGEKTIRCSNVSIKVERKDAAWHMK